MKTNKKTYILDTTVLMDNAEIIESLKGSRIVIPLTVIGQLDGLKNNENKEKAEKARKASRAILEAQGRKEIEVVNNFKKGADVLNSSADNKIIGTCLRLKEQGEDVIVLTTDINMKITAKSMGIEAKDSILTPAKKAALQEFKELKRKLLTILLAIIFGIPALFFVGGSVIPGSYEKIPDSLVVCIFVTWILMIFISGIVAAIILNGYPKVHDIEKEVEKLDIENNRDNDSYDNLCKSTELGTTMPGNIDYIKPLGHPEWGN